MWLAVVGFVALVALRWWQESHRPRPPEVLPADRYEIAEVLDGETVRLTNHAVVRLIGVDAPDMASADKVRDGPEPLAEEALEYTRAFFAGAAVRIDLDRERIDRRDRFWVYAYNTEGKMLNEELLRAGLARIRLHYFSEANKRRFLKIEKEARQAGRGVWARSG